MPSPNSFVSASIFRNTMIPVSIGDSSTNLRIEKKTHKNNKIKSSSGNSPSSETVTPRKFISKQEHILKLKYSQRSLEKLEKY